MGRSQESFSKKEVRIKNDKKRKEKAQKREKKKNVGKSSFNDMIAYVDEYGKISATPPDPDKKIIVDVDTIEINPPKNNSKAVPDFMRKGVIVNFNTSRGFGIIRDMVSGQSVFVHKNNLQESVKENDVVVFEVGKGPKGLYAMKVKLLKE
jgi:cold shock CspA family protein